MRLEIPLVAIPRNSNAERNRTGFFAFEKIYREIMTAEIFRASWGVRLKTVNFSIALHRHQNFAHPRLKPSPFARSPIGIIRIVKMKIPAPAFFDLPLL